MQIYTICIRIILVSLSLSENWVKTLALLPNYLLNKYIKYGDYQSQAEEHQSEGHASGYDEAALLEGIMFNRIFMDVVALRQRRLLKQSSYPVNESDRMRNQAAQVIGEDIALLKLTLNRAVLIDCLTKGNHYPVSKAVKDSADNAEYEGQ